MREAVVDSPDVKWKPIDEVAWRVVAPAPWYCKPPELRQTPSTKEIKAIKYELKRLVKKEKTFDARRARRDARAKAKGNFTSISIEEIESVANRRKRRAFQIEQLTNMLMLTCQSKLR